ncbi:MAG: metal-dependent transcriptional regulator [Oscillospiraceae bacterium]|nr:metal-dependent transcriptional regulator [Oscillospiraceae bacterium]
MPDIEGRESPEMYLKTVYLIRKDKGYCRSVDIAKQLNVSKPSVSVAINKLKNEGYVTVDEDGMVQLTDAGQKRAEIVYEKFQFWTDVLEKFGIGAEEAEAEACKFEHAMSDDAFFQIKFDTKA